MTTKPNNTPQYHELVPPDRELVRLCTGFRPDESLLFVNDTTGALIRVFEVARDGSLGEEQIFFNGIGSYMR